jgi:hypothetical protein
MVNVPISNGIAILLQYTSVMYGQLAWLAKWVLLLETEEWPPV